MGFIPQNKRRTYIYQSRELRNADKLPSAFFEDKIVEVAVKRVIEQIYEPIFLDCSYGYRENPCIFFCAKKNNYKPNL